MYTMLVFVLLMLPFSRVALESRRKYDGARVTSSTFQNFMLQMLPTPRSKLATSESWSLTWSYSLSAHLEKARACRDAVIAAGILREAEMYGYGPDFQEIFLSLTLTQLRVSVLYLGDRIEGDLFQNISYQLNSNDACSAQTNITVSVDISEHARATPEAYRSYSFIILSARQSCTNEVVMSLSHLLREGGWVYVHTASQMDCSNLRNMFSATNSDGRLYVKTMHTPSFPEVWEALLLSSVLSMNAEGWKTLYHGMGHAGEVRWQIAALSNLIRWSAQRTHVCEVGFNSGHSALTMLSSNNYVTMTSFDLGELPWTFDMVNRIHALFPNRFSYIQGSSRVSLPQYAVDMQRDSTLKACDVIFVDGDHSLKGAKADFQHATMIANSNALLIADDYSPSFPGVISAWNELEREGKLSTFRVIRMNTMYQGFFKGWVIGTIHSSDTKSNSNPKRIINVATTQCGADTQLTENLMKSMLASVTPGEIIALHVIISDDTPREALDKMKELWELGGMRLSFHDAALHRNGTSHFATCSMDRLLLPDLVSARYVIYLDRDTLVMKSLRQLHDAGMKMGEKFIGIVPEGGSWYTTNHGRTNSGVTYVGSSGVNAGVMLMNLQKMRKTNFHKEILAYSKDVPNLTLGDQDLINHYFARRKNDVLILPCSFNYRMVRSVATECTCDDIEELSAHVECLNRNNLDDAVILHGNRNVFLYGNSTFAEVWHQLRRDIVLGDR